MEPPELELLKAPTAAAPPCGPSLEDSPELAAFNAYRVFGQSTAWEQPPDWRELRGRALETLGRSKDIRILAHFAAAALRTDGLAALLASLGVAADWLEGFWEGVYPGLDEEGIFRRNALSCFADRIAIIDALRRAPLVANRQLGAFSLRDHELAQGTLQPTEADTHVKDAAQVAAAFAAMEGAELAALVGQVEAAQAALKRIETKTREAIGTEGTPDLQPLAQQLQKILALLREQLAAHPSGAGADAAAGGAAEGAAGGGVGGPIRSRQDAIRALDAVAAFFRQTEPSSPVPLFVERAKRLVAKSFLEVLEDMMPDSVAQARQVGGVREAE
ncbi:MAG TPA: type VI secretion system protein TssA [Steroidobacteraceae bacterium]|nr:type VI secretion system protein TssA [Steroidobacteraceae bacterium]